MADIGEKGSPSRVFITDARRQRSDMVANAASATNKECNMSLLQGIKLYPKAIGWAVVISTCCIIEGFSIGDDRSYQVSAMWQATISNGAEVGQILSLLHQSPFRTPPKSARSPQIGYLFGQSDIPSAPVRFNVRPDCASFYIVVARPRQRQRRLYAPAVVALQQFVCYRRTAVRHMQTASSDTLEGQRAGLGISDMIATRAGQNEHD